MTRHAHEAGSAAPTPSTPDLKGVLCLVYLREKRRDELTWLRACCLAAEDTGGHDRLTPSDEQRSIFRAVGNEETSLDAVRGDDRLRLIVQMTWLEPARTQIREEESLRLGRSQFAESSWEVMYNAYIAAVWKLVPDLSFLRSPDLAEGWKPEFKEYCEWLVTGEGTPYEKWHEAFRILDEAPFCNDLLSTLWSECEVECRDITLPNPPAPKIDGPILSDHASAIYELLLSLPPHAGMTGPKILEVSAKKGIIIDDGALTSRYLPELKPYGLENKKRIGYRIPESRRPRR